MDHVSVIENELSCAGFLACSYRAVPINRFLSCMHYDNQAKPSEAEVVIPNLNKRCELFSKFTRVLGLMSDHRDAVQKKTFTKWVNNHLQKVWFVFISLVFVCWSSCGSYNRIGMICPG